MPLPLEFYQNDEELNPHPIKCGICGKEILITIKIKPQLITEWDYAHPDSYFATCKRVFVCCGKAWFWNSYNEDDYSVRGYAVDLEGSEPPVV